MAPYCLRLSGSIFDLAVFFAGFADRAAALGFAETLADFLFVFFFFAAFAILEILLKKRVVRRTLTHPHALRTRILWRNVITVKRTLFAVALVCALFACSRLQPLTVDVLQQAEAKWMAHRPPFYRLTIEMSGDRVETGRFEVTVRGGQVESLRRNGLVIQPNAGQDYSMDGLFHMLEQELGLAERPATLGAPEGYAVYLYAKFDDMTGRLIRYQRTVGGASNSIDVNVIEFKW
jgi:hypothetical protein